MGAFEKETFGLAHPAHVITACELRNNTLYLISKRWMIIIIVAFYY